MKEDLKNTLNIGVFCVQRDTVSRTVDIYFTPYLFQSIISWNGITKVSDRIIGMQPAAIASSNTGWANRVPRNTIQKTDF